MAVVDPRRDVDVYLEIAQRAYLAVADTPTVIDVLTPAEYADYLIEGAENLPFDRLMLHNTEPLSKDEELVVVCLSGFRAGIAASMLRADGYTRVSILGGGMTAWQG